MDLRVYLKMVDSFHSSPNYHQMSAPFQTFVFLDLEATGLRDDRPRVTELCLAAVHRFSLEHPPRGGRVGPQLPRVMDKLCLCADPHKLVCQRTLELSGLSNENLTENCKPGFDKVAVSLLNGFLQRQAPPATASATTFLSCGRSCCNHRGYSLATLYRRFYQSYPPVSHCAEADVSTLIVVFLSQARDLLVWADLNACPWESTPPMYNPSPRKPLRTPQETQNGGTPKRQMKVARSSQALGLG
ncbi:three prime repair exonuclease 2-like [Acipenser ruthenus]|uniref:three prime repair exonuclease 2-like n=1 Tax=Acipenser ruthenus TaxID=7906 RepID=UPI0027410B63|nr:three prime repair exonuclease 2-like [Acipenser ruthenus]